MYRGNQTQEIVTGTVTDARQTKRNVGTLTRYDARRRVHTSVMRRFIQIVSLNTCSRLHTVPHSLPHCMPRGGLDNGLLRMDAALSYATSFTFGHETQTRDFAYAPNILSAQCHTSALYSRIDFDSSALRSPIIVPLPQ